MRPRRSDPLHRTRTNITRGEDSGHRGFQVGRGQVIDPELSWHVASGEDESRRIARDFLGEPVAAWLGAKEEEQTLNRALRALCGLGVLDGEPFQPAPAPAVDHA